MHKKIAVCFTAAALICLPLASCGNKKNNGTSAENAEVSSSSAADETSTTASETETASTTEAPSEKITEAPTQEKTDDGDNSGDAVEYKDSLSIAKAFYKAYLEHDPQTVYDMFNEDEIALYRELIKDGLKDKEPEVVFSQTAVIAAIDESMNSIDTIIEAYTDSDNDKWSVDVNKDIIKEVKKDELKEFNKSLGTDYTSGVVIEYVDYCNTTNKESFTGNSSAFLEKNGRWYLSYSSIMQSDLLNYLEV